jgi:hypothetical protein
MAAHPGWDNSSTWDDEPSLEGSPAPSPVAAAGGASGATRATRAGRVTRAGTTRNLAAEAVARSPRLPRWRRRAAVTLLGVAVLAGAMLLVARVPVTRAFHPAEPAWPRQPAHPAAGRAPLPGHPVRASAASLGRGYAFSLPAGWQDQTRQLAALYGSVRPTQILTGRASDGFVADLSVLREPLAVAPSLQQLAAALPATLPGASPAGGPRRLSLGGAPALAADWTLHRGGHLLRARQVASYHHGAIWLLTFTAEAAAFPSDVAALDQAIRTWRWAS